MADPINIEGIDATLSVRPGEKAASTKADEQPFRMLIVGDFSSRVNRGVETRGDELARRRPIPIDRDNDDAIMKKLGVAVRLRWEKEEAPPIELSFDELDDFTPDAIYHRCDLFEILRDTRKGLRRPETFAQTAATLTGKDPERRSEPPQEPAGPAEAPDFEQETTGSLLDDILDRSSPSVDESRRATGGSQWDRFLNDLVAPHLVPDIEKEQQALIEIIDTAISETMAGILHHPDFRDLEAAWRAMRFLVRRLETGEDLILYLLDVSRPELTADLTSVERLEDTGLFRCLAAASPETAGKDHWGAIVGNFNFDKTKKDVVTLARLGAICQYMQAPFIAGANSSLVGSTSIVRQPDPDQWNSQAAPEDEKAWQVLRKLPEAAWIGLGIPRFLLRLPYGEHTESVDAFDFEEIQDPTDPNGYLWANPAFAVAHVLGRTFTHQGWRFGGGLASGIDGLPLYVYKQDGASKVLPCAEALLSDAALETLMDRGAMALLSFRGQDRIRLSRLQSIASPPTALGGRWLDS